MFRTSEESKKKMVQTHKKKNEGEMSNTLWNEEIKLKDDGVVH